MTFAMPSLVLIFFQFSMKIYLSLSHSSSLMPSNANVHISKVNLKPPLKSLVTIKNTYNLAHFVSISRSPFKTHIQCIHKLPHCLDQAFSVFRGCWSSIYEALLDKNLNCIGARSIDIAFTI